MGQREGKDLWLNFVAMYTQVNPVTRGRRGFLYRWPEESNQYSSCTEAACGAGYLIIINLGIVCNDGPRANEILV